MKLYDKKFWVGREDGLAKDRFFSRVIPVSLESLDQYSEKYVLLGFACDEGVRRNLGRLGAKEGPQEIRKALRNFSVHFDPLVNILDVGDVLCEGEKLEEAQEKLASVVAQIRSFNKIPVVLGGGHETAWGHFLGLKEDILGSKLGVVNFDAHFDLRVCDSKNLASSGTPFFQAADLCQNLGRKFSYAAVGIEDFSNTSLLFQKAKELGTLTIRREEIQEQGLLEAEQRLKAFCEPLDKIYLSLCLDVISASHAPGVSAPNPLGLYPRELHFFVKFLVKTGKVAAFDLVELSPPNDIDGVSARLSAFYVYFFLSMLL